MENLLAYIEDLLDGFESSDKEWRQAVLAENGVSNSADLFKDLLSQVLEAGE